MASIVSGRMPLASTGVGEFGLSGLLTYTHGKNLDTDDGLYNIMPLNGKLALTQRWAAGTTRSRWLVGAKDDVSDVRNEIKTAGYGLTNLRGSYSWKQVRIDFGVDNLFDKFYYAAARRGLYRSGIDHDAQRHSLGHRGSRHGPLDLHRPELQVLKAVVT